MKTTLNGTENAIDVLGRYVSIKNNSAEVIYASSTQGVDTASDNVTPIQPGESTVIQSCNKKVYVLGDGDIAYESCNQLFNFFKPAPRVGGENVYSIFKEGEGLSEQYKYAYKVSGGYGYVTVDNNYIHLSPIDVKNLLLMSDASINNPKVYIEVEVIKNTGSGSATAAYVLLGTGYNASQLAWQPGTGLTGGFATETLASQQQPNFLRQVISFDLSEVKGNPLCFSFVNVDCDMYVYNIWAGK